MSQTRKKVKTGKDGSRNDASYTDADCVPEGNAAMGNIDVKLGQQLTRLSARKLVPMTRDGSVGNPVPARLTNPVSSASSPLGPKLPVLA
jgi:hypothetical protein